jgi:hypothetical protein
MLGESGCHLRWNMPTARMDQPHYLQQFLLGHALKNVTPSARPHCPLDIAVAIRSRQHNDASVWIFSSNGYECIRPIRAWKPKIHQGNVGTMTTELCDGLRCIRGQSNQKHVWL